MFLKERIPWGAFHGVTVFCKDIEKLRAIVEGKDFLDWSLKLQVYGIVQLSFRITLSDILCHVRIRYANLSFQLLRKVTFAQFWKRKWEQKRKREQSFCPILRGPHMSFFFILLICERRKFLPRNSRFYSIIPKKFVRVKSKFDKTLCSSLR